MKKTQALDVRSLRLKRQLNQQQFWARIGVTQSAGSRYETGRNVPRPVQHLVRLVYVEDIDIAKLQRSDVEIAAFLKATAPDRYKELAKAAREWRRR